MNLHSLHAVYEDPQVQVWSCNLDCNPSAVDISILSGEEQHRAGLFYQDLQRQRYIVAHVALRQLLGMMTGKPANTLRFSIGPFGKPNVDSNPAWFFNLSHSGGTALIALSPSCEIGVDIELRTHIGEMTELAEQHFGGSELLEWNALPEHMKRDAFYKVWTRKEACVKATGWGLQLSLPTVVVGSDCARRLVRAPLPDGSIATIEVLSLELAGDNAGAVACLMA